MPLQYINGHTVQSLPMASTRTGTFRSSDYSTYYSSPARLAAKNSDRRQLQPADRAWSRSRTSASTSTSELNKQCDARLRQIPTVKKPVHMRDPALHIPQYLN